MTEELGKEEVGKRLKESDWIVIVALWERGEVTLSELSDRFGISKPALSQGLKRRKAVRGSKAHIATKKIQEKVEAEKEKLVEDIYNFKKRFIGYGNFLADTAMTIVKEAKAPGGGGLANARGELASIFEATKTFTKIRDDMYHLYGMYDTENNKEEDMNFNVGVYSQQDIDDLRKAQEVFATATGDEEDEPDVEDGDPEDQEYEGI